MFSFFRKIWKAEVPEEGSGVASDFSVENLEARVLLAADGLLSEVDDVLELGDEGHFENENPMVLEVTVEQRADLETVSEGSIFDLPGALVPVVEEDLDDSSSRVEEAEMIEVIEVEAQPEIELSIEPFARNGAFKAELEFESNPTRAGPVEAQFESQMLKNQQLKSLPVPGGDSLHHFKVLEKAAEFDGSDTRMAFATNGIADLALVEDGSWEMWVRFDETFIPNVDVPDFVLFTLYDWSNSESNYELTYSPEQQQLSFMAGGATTSTEWWVLEADGGWNHIAVTKDNTSVKIYVDGVDQTAPSETGTHGDIVMGSNTALYLNHHPSTLTGYDMFDGEIDELRIWDEALTAQEVLDWKDKIIDSSHPRVDGSDTDALVLNHHFENLSGLLYMDSSGVETTLHRGNLDGTSAEGMGQAPVSDGLSLSDNTFVQESGDVFALTWKDGEGGLREVPADLPEGVVSRWDRNWTVDITDEGSNGGQVDLNFDFSDVGESFVASASYHPLVRTGDSGDFSALEVVSSSIAGDVFTYTVEVTEVDGLVVTLGEVAGADNTALDMDIADYFSLPYSSTQYIDEDGTWEFWARYDNNDTPNEIFYIMQDGGTDRIEMYQDTIYVAMGNDATRSLSGQVTVGEWMHVAVTKDGASVKTYVNGVDVTDPANTGNHSVAVNYSSGTAYFNHSTTWTSQDYHLDGQYDEWRIWNTALDQATIQDYMNRELDFDHPNYDGTESDNLVVYYTFDDVSGTIIPDHSGSGNDATLTNTANATEERAPVLPVVGMNHDFQHLWTGATSSSSLSGLSIVDVDFLSDAADRIILSHDGETATFLTTLLGTNLTGRSGRSWYVEVQDDQSDGGTVDLNFDFSDLGLTYDAGSSYTVSVANPDGVSNYIELVPTTSSLVGDVLSLTVNGADLDGKLMTLATRTTETPSFTAGSDISVDEDSGAHTLSLWATLLNTGSILDFEETLSFTVTPADSSYFSVQPSVNSSGDLSFTGAANAQGSTTFEVLISDSAGASSSPETINLTLTNTDDPAALSTLDATTVISFGGSVSAVNDSLEIIELDGDNITGATLTFTSGYVNGNDILAYTDSGSITGSWDAGLGAFTLSGSSSVADYQAALRSITYENLAVSPSTTDRELGLVLTDSAGTDSNTITLTLDPFIPSDLTYTWTGAVDSDWSTAGNWDVGHVPLVNSMVVIPDVSGSPTITYGDSVVLSLQSLNSSEEIALTDGGLSLTTSASSVDVLTLSGDAVFSTSIGLSQGGAVNTSGTSSIMLTGGTWVSQADITLGASSSITLAIGSTLQLSSSTLTSPSDLTVLGTLSGTGTVITNLTNAGTLWPGIVGGVETGTISVSGNYLQTGTLKLDLEDGSNADVLAVTGNMDVTAGALEIFLQNSFSANQGDVIGLTPITFSGTNAGDFASSTLPNDNATTTFQANSLDVDFTLTANAIGETVRDGITNFNLQLDDFGAYFDLDEISGGTDHPTLLLPDTLDSMFDVQTTLQSYDLPTIGTASNLTQVAELLVAAGYTVEGVTGGTTLASGEIIADTLGSELIVFSYEATVASEMDVAGGYVGTDFENELPAIWDGLASDATWSSSSLTHTADLKLELSFGVDGSGIYLRPDAGFVLDVDSSGTLSGTATVAGSSRSTSATVTSDLSLGLRLNDDTSIYALSDVLEAQLDDELVVELDGSVNLVTTLAFNGLSLTRASLVTAISDSDQSTSVTESATLSGSFSVVAFEDGSDSQLTLVSVGDYDGGEDDWNFSFSQSTFSLASGLVGSNLNINQQVSSSDWAVTGGLALKLDAFDDNGAEAEVNMSISSNTNNTLTMDVSESYESLGIDKNGSTILEMTNAVLSSSSVGLDLNTGNLSGSLSFSAETTNFLPGQTVFTFSVNDGEDANTIALEGGFDLGLGLFTSLSFDSFEFILITHIEVQGSDINVDLEAAGTSDLLLDVESLILNIGSGVFVGSLEGFAIDGMGLLVPQEGFAASFATNTDLNNPDSLDALKWPWWFPVKITSFRIEWDNFANDPLDFKLLLDVEADFSETFENLGLDEDLPISFSGAIRNVQIDTGLLMEGKMPIVNIGSVELSFEIDIRVPVEFKVSGQVLGGIVRFDSENQVIAEDDFETEVAARVVYFGMYGEAQVAGYAGFIFRMGLSSLGPIQGYFGLTAPLPIEFLASGLGFNSIAAGITLNSELADITDAKDLETDPSFKFANELSLLQWKTVLVDAIADRYETLAGVVDVLFDPDLTAALDAFWGVLTTPMKIEGSVSGTVLYWGGKTTFEFTGNIMMDNRGRVLLGVELTAVGGGFEGSAKMYFNLLSMVQGDAAILFNGFIPSDLQLIQVVGGLTFDTVWADGVEPPDPLEGNPIDNIEQYLADLPVPEALIMRVDGAVIFDAMGYAKISLSGSVEMTLDIDDAFLQMDFEGDLSFKVLALGEGTLGSGKGRFILDFLDPTEAAQAVLDGDTEALIPELYGVSTVSVNPDAIPFLSLLGMSFDAAGELRLNATNEVQSISFVLPGESDETIYQLQPLELSIKLQGYVMMTLPDGTPWYMLKGSHGLLLNTDNFMLYSDSQYILGLEASPLFEMEVEALVYISDAGMAGKFKFARGLGDAFEDMGIEFNVTMEAAFNTTGEEVSVTLPNLFPDVVSAESITISATPIRIDTLETIEAGPYFYIYAEGNAVFLDNFELRGIYRLLVTPDAIDLRMNVWGDLMVGGQRLMLFNTVGGVTLDMTGLWGRFSVDISAGIPSGAGFSLTGTTFLEFNTTGESKSIDSYALSQGRYLRISIDGALSIGAARLEGLFWMYSDANSASIELRDVQYDLMAGSTQLFQFSATGAIQINSNLLLTAVVGLQVQAGLPSGMGFGMGGTYTLALNTTQQAQVLGGISVAAHELVRVRVSGYLEIGNFRIDETFSFAVPFHGIEIVVDTDWDLVVSGTRILGFDIFGTLVVNEEGIFGALSASLNAGIPSGFGFNLEGTYVLLFNSTGRNQSAGGYSISSSTLFGVRLSGSLRLGLMNLEGSYDFSINSTYINVSVSGRAYLMSDYLTISGNLEIHSDGMAMSVFAGRAARFGGMLILGDMYLDINTRSTTTLGVAPGLVAIEVRNATYSIAGFSLEGHATMSFSGTNFSMSFDGYMSLFGDLLSLNGQMNIYTDGVVISLGMGGYINAGFLVLDGDFSFHLNTRTVTTSGLGSGTARVTIENLDLAIGGFQVTGSATIGVVSGYFSMSMDGYVGVFGDRLYLSGVMEVHADGAAMDVALSGWARASFMDIHGDFRLQVNTRSSTTLGISGATARIAVSNLYISIAGISLTGSVSITVGGGVFRMDDLDLTANIYDLASVKIGGYIHSDGSYNIYGTSSLNIGHWSAVELNGVFHLRLDHNSGLRGYYEGKVYVRFAHISNVDILVSFTRDSFVFSTSIDHYIYSDLWIDGDIEIEVLSNGVYGRFSGRAGLWGMRGSLSGYFDTRDGRNHWRLDGAMDYDIGSRFIGSYGTLYIDVGHDRASFSVRGRAWAGFKVWYWDVWWWGSGWDYYWAGVDEYFSAGLDIDNGRMYVDIGGKEVGIRFSGGFDVYLSNISGGTAFLDVNGNEALDEGEVSTEIDEEGKFDFNGEEGPGSEDKSINLLGALAAYDLNGDGELNEDEGQMIAIGGVEGVPVTTFFRDDNDNNLLEEEEVSVSLSGEDALSQITLMLAIIDGDHSGELGVWSAFDLDGDGLLSLAEQEVIEELDASLDPSYHNIDNAIKGSLSIVGATSVFFDANDNGVMDSGETSVVVSEEGYYTFEDASTSSVKLGLLAPFDSNKNGQIDPEEGIIVIQGGVDSDSGVENSTTVKTLATNIGIEQTVNPFTTVQVALVEQGVDAVDAGEAVAEAFGLEGVDLTTFNPSDSSDDEHVNDILANATKINTIMTQGSALLGDNAEEAITNQLALTILNTDGLIDITNVETVSSILTSVAESVGSEVSETILEAASQVVADTNATVELVAESGTEDLDKVLSEIKAANQLSIGDSLTKLAAGEVSVSEFSQGFSPASLASVLFVSVENESVLATLTQTTNTLAAEEAERVNDINRVLFVSILFSDVKVEMNFETGSVEDDEEAIFKAMTLFISSVRKVPLQLNENGLEVTEENIETELASEELLGAAPSVQLPLFEV